MMSTILAAVAEFERDLISERVRPGLEAAKAKGKKLGRKTGDNYRTGNKEAKALRLLEAGCLYREVAAKCGISPASVTNIVKRNSKASA